ncbi:MAG: type VI secretion system tip protein VgrG [Polyangiaceae bacterium]|nr:type VI secretion system tip protein VgrG [Polyangiaceae bacterium]
MVSVSGLTRHSLRLEAGIPVFVVAYNGVERLGAVYRFEVHFVVENQVEVDLAELIGGRATLSTEQDHISKFVINGLVSQADLMEVTPTHSLYRVELVPELWRAALSRHTRVFVDVTIKDVLQKMFDALGFDSETVKLAFSSSDCRKYPQICQFEESDLDFMTRWMEKEGLHYYFEQGRKEERVVIVSGQPARQSLAEGPLVYATGGALVTRTVRRFRSRSRLQTRKIEVRAYDAANPSTTSEASHDLGGKRAGTGVSVALSTEIQRPKVEREAQILEEIEVTQRLLFTGEADAPVFRAGYHFELEGHPLPRLDGDYYITQVRHQALQPCPDCANALSLLDLTATSASYSCSFDCVGADITYRLPRETPVPRVYGTLSGEVDGPSTDDYAQIDSAGRYRVRLRFDEHQKTDGSASMWVRMLQNHAGNPEGIHFPLRKGTEVMLVFLGGDPDQPLIVGAVPNAVTASPVTSTNHSLNVLHTAGDNHFELDDQRGSQRIELKTPTETTQLHMGAPQLVGENNYNLIQTTQGDGYVHTGRNLDVKVEGNHTETIGGKRTSSVSNDVVELFSSNQTTNVLGDVKWTVAGDYDGTVEGDYDLEVKGSYTVDYDEDTVTTVHANYSSTIVGAKNENFLGAVNSNWAAAVNNNFGGVVNSNFVGAVNNNFLGVALNTYVGGAVNLKLAAGVDVNVALPTVVNVAGSLTCDFALAGSLFVGGTLSIRLAVDITLALVSLNVTLLNASETVLSFSNNIVEASGKCIDLMKSDTQVNNTSASVTP